MKITKQLTITLVGVSALILLVNLALARWSFEQGLKDFFVGLEQQRLQRLSDSLLRDYIRAGNRWSIFEQISLREYTRQQQEPRDDRRRLPPPPKPDPFANSQQRRRGKPQSAPLPPTALFSNNGEQISGDISQHSGELVRQPIQLNGKPIGELRSLLMVKDISPLATQFSRQQLWASLIIGLLCLLVAILVSQRVAKKLLKPVREILNGVKQLSDGQYTIQFKNHSKDELGELMGNLERLSLTLEKNRSAKNRWFANISHELRTPLTVLQGEIEVLKAGIRPFNRQQLESFEQEIRLLQRLVNDLYQLSTSDIGALRYHFDQLNLSDWIKDTIKTVKTQATQKGLSIQVNIQEDIIIQADAQRIEQLLLNVLANSLAYTNAPGKIEIELAQLTTNKGPKALLTITDSAPGVPSEDLELIFDPLYRLDSSRQARESGAGLGLALCKNIADAHQADIKALPSSLGGVSIQVTFNILQEPDNDL